MDTLNIYKMKQETKIWITIVLIIALVIFGAIAADAQNWKKGLAIVGYHTATIALGAVADGLSDDGYKEWGHALHAVEVGALISGPFIFKPRGTSEIAAYICSYGFLRFSLFDGFYNMTRDLPLLYNGTTSTYDEIMNMHTDFGKGWWKTCSLIVGISIPIKSF